MPEHRPVRGSPRCERDAGAPDPKTEPPVPRDVSFGHGLQVARLPRLIGPGEDGFKETRTDPHRLRAWLDAHRLEVPVRLRGVQLRQAGREPQEPAERPRRGPEYPRNVRRGPELPPHREGEPARRQPGGDPEDLAATARHV